MNVAEPQILYFLTRQGLVFNTFLTFVRVCVTTQSCLGLDINLHKSIFKIYSHK